MEQKLMETQIKETGCCKPFDPAPWEDKEVTWDKKVFVKDHVTSLFHIPINMGKKVVKNLELIQKAQAEPVQQLMLCDEKSLWGCDIYIDVAKEVAGAEIARTRGNNIRDVFDSSF